MSCAWPVSVVSIVWPSESALSDALEQPAASSPSAMAHTATDRAVVRNASWVLTGLSPLFACGA